ncbi:MAG: pyruvate, phosphate dikinase [Gammaproteobacteria bacterium RBG_16_51_14]|nr:MAG: pyruvate, phosphate dikinase [Gammaproteobacteria bacterium RBG_16_51_14]
MAKYVYSFEEGNKSMKELLGGKGANLAEMTSLGIHVPPGFTITTEVCDQYHRNGKTLSPEVIDQISEYLDELQVKMNKTLGNKDDPLLVSVRSGAADSMPGMMDTVLNLGLNDESVQGLANKTVNQRFAWDAYRRFIQMFGHVVMEIDSRLFESVLKKIKEAKGVKYDSGLDKEDLKKVVEKFKQVVHAERGESFPQDPRKQLEMSIKAVFNSWHNERATLYRKLYDIRGLLGTAVNVQSMVFGNTGESSATGVCFTRNPATGENKFYGEFLVNAQGEDVVAGIRTPDPISKLNEIMPDAYQELLAIRKKLENHFRDMQDMEFTIEEGHLFMLQTRNGKRTAESSLRIAVEMVEEGLLTKKEAILRIDPNQLDQLMHKHIDKDAVPKAISIAKGLPASPGAAVGEIVFDAHEADALANDGRKVILVRTETSPEDLIGMNAAQGILTSRGGMTSHAAVVARGMGKCCVAGCGDIRIDEEKETLSAAGLTLKKGDYITLDGSTGNVYEGRLPLQDPELSDNFDRIMEWADEFRTLQIRTNADTPHDAANAIRFGAQGIGLCRTEHMFFEGPRIRAMREMILAGSVEERKKALARLLPYQKEDFKGIFKVMDGLPVTIRLLDPPLHEFLPREEEEISVIAEEMRVTPELIKTKIEELYEQNPMLGHRGCRLGITYPEITEMQARAIFEAAIEITNHGYTVLPEVMIPLVGNINEFIHQKKVVVATANAVMEESGTRINYLIGTMIEVPRGALTADVIAREAEFFSFGTNDLTQMTLGFSRDDAGKFVPAYINLGILDHDPFQVLDRNGVGQLIKIAIDKGRSSRPDIKMGICGEHGGEPSSIEFYHEAGLDYVSCSPFRVPIARVAAAQAALKNQK